MSYGSYGSGRYSTSGYGSYGSGSRKYGSSYVPSYSRRSVGSYGLTSSYVPYSSSPLSLTRQSKSPTVVKTEPERGQLQISKSEESIRSDDESESDYSSFEEGSERIGHRYGSSSLADTSSDISVDASSRHSSLSCSQSSFNEEDIRNYKELYDEIKRENKRLKEAILIVEKELDRTKMQMQTLSQNNAVSHSLSETEKKEKRSLERKLSEMEEEMKDVSKLKIENDKLKAENRALSRVVCQLSK